MRLAPGPLAPHLPHDTRKMPPGLAEVADAWPTLPEAIRAGILAMVRASAPGGMARVTGVPADLVLASRERALVGFK